MNNLRPPKFKFAIYLLPGILLYVFAVFVPVLGALYYSMFDWMGGAKKTFAGLQNYVTLLHDETFWQALKNNLVLTMI